MQGSTLCCIVDGMVDEAAVRKLFSDQSLTPEAFYTRAFPHSRHGCAGSTRLRATRPGSRFVISTVTNARPFVASGTFPTLHRECVSGLRFAA